MVARRVDVPMTNDKARAAVIEAVRRLLAADDIGDGPYFTRRVRELRDKVTELDIMEARHA